MKILESAISALLQAGCDKPKLDAELLMAHVLGVSRIGLITRADKEITEAQKTAFEALLARRIQREPVAYIVGEKEFWSMRFKVSPATLCPRPDTEIMIESALKLFPRDAALNIADLGTGTGAILLALLSEFPNARGTAVDISPQALEIAKENGRNLGLASRADFLLGSWLETLSGSFDLIVSNPPYIESSLLPELSPEVAVFEPKSALDGGKDGLDAYREIVPQLRERLRPGGWVILEVGVGQVPAIANLMSEQDLQVTSIAKDYQGIDRCVIAQRA